MPSTGGWRHLGAQWRRASYCWLCGHARFMSFGSLGGRTLPVRPCGPAPADFTGREPVRSSKTSGASKVSSDVARVCALVPSRILPSNIELAYLIIHDASLKSNFLLLPKRRHCRLMEFSHVTRSPRSCKETKHSVFLVEKQSIIGKTETGRKTRSLWLKASD